MKEIQKKIEEIRDNIKSLKQEEFSLIKSVSNVFNEKALTLTYPLIVKWSNKSCTTGYFFLSKPSDIESRIWQTEKTIYNSVHVKGLNIIQKSSGELSLQNEFLGRENFLFSFFDTFETISEEEFKSLVEKWYQELNEFYMTPDEEYEANPNWFVEYGYDEYFKRNENFLPNNETI